MNVFELLNIELYLTAIRETLFMTLVSSFFSYLIGIPLGISLFVFAKDGLNPKPLIYDILSIIVNVFRSIPFLILLILVLPITMFLVKTQIGAISVIPPLIFSATPYIARMVESSLKEINSGVIEAAKSMGASNFQIITKVLLPESKPSLLVGAAISITTILGYSAMAGAVGGGGLGDVAIRYGYYRYKLDIMMITVVLLVIIVQIIQEIFMGLSRKTDKRQKV